MLSFPFWPCSLLVWSQYLIGWCPMTQCDKKICYGVLFNTIYYSLYLKTFICWCCFDLKLNRIMLKCYHFWYQLAIGYNFSLPLTYKLFSPSIMDLNAYISLLPHIKYLLLVTFCATTIGLGSVTGWHERTGHCRCMDRETWMLK